MNDTRLRVLEVELTYDEWRTITRMAALLDMTTSDVLREAMHLAPLASDDAEQDCPSPRTDGGRRRLP